MSDAPVETFVPPKPTALQDLRRAGKLVAKEAGGQTVNRFFAANRATLEAVLPKHITPDRMLKIAMGALRTTPKLMDCSIESLFGSVIKCAQMGLEPNTHQGHVFLIPFYNNRKKVTEVQVIAGYKGLVELARRSGLVTSIYTQVRYDNDEWRLRYGSDPEIYHVPADDERGNIRGFYAVARLKGEDAPQFEYMTLAEVEKIRDASKGYQTAKRFANGGTPDTPWATNFEMMGRKTPLRRLANMLPQSIELAHAVALDAQAEKGMSQGLDRVLEGEWTPADLEAEAEVVMPSQEQGAAPEQAGREANPEGGSEAPAEAQESQETPKKAAR